MKDSTVFETASWIARQCADCAVPGYLVLLPKEPVTSFSSMAPKAWQDLGTAMLIACRAIEAVIEPERLYVARFGEGGQEIHFHLFPRTQWLKEQYREAIGNPDGPVSGPLMLQWARDRFKTDCPLPPSSIRCQEAVAALRKETERIRTSECARFQ